MRQSRDLPKHGGGVMLNCCADAAYPSRTMRCFLVATCWIALAAAGASVLLAQEPAPDRVAKIVAPLVDEQTVAVIHGNLMAFDVATTIDLVARGLQWPEEVRDRLQVEFAPVQVVTQGLPETTAVDAILVISFSDLAQLPFFLVLPVDKTTPAKAIALEARRAISQSWRREVITEEIGETSITGAPATLERLKKAKAVARPEIAAAFQAAGQGGVQFAIVPSAAMRKLAESLAPKLPERLGGGPTKAFTQGIVWAAVGVDLPPKPIAVRVVLQSTNPEAATLLESEICKLFAALGEFPQFKEAVPKFGELSKRLVPTASGDRLTLELTNANGGLDALGAILPTFTRILSGTLAGGRREEPKNEK